MFADLYRACAAIGVLPRQVDELEIWEVAVLLGADVESKDVFDSSADDDGHALLRARLAHAQGLGPKPEAAPMSLADARAVLPM